MNSSDKNKEKSAIKKHITLTYKTHEALIVGFLFCKHIEGAADTSDGIWALINPEQTEFVNKEKVINFLKMMQELAIEIPWSDAETQQNKKLSVYFKKCRTTKKIAIENTWQSIMEGQSP